MIVERIGYRARQFWSALRAVPDPADLQLAQTYLNSRQMELFVSMQPSEQVHSLQVFKQLYLQASQTSAQGEDHYSDLLVAGLLHDVGKSRQPLFLWERVLIVLVHAIFPQRMKRWGRLPEHNQEEANRKFTRLNWRRPFIVAEQHPRWGAEMVASAGASPLATSLILRHQQEISAPPITLEERYLHQLQSVDSIL
jgi:hypothetical protein